MRIIKVNEVFTGDKIACTISNVDNVLATVLSVKNMGQLFELELNLGTDDIKWIFGAETEVILLMR